MKLSEIFREAKALLPSARYICIALEQHLTRARFDVSYADVLPAVRIVRERIDFCYTANEFVARQHGFGRDEEGCCIEEILHEAGIDMHQWRLDFLDGLIAEYEAKGE